MLRSKAIVMGLLVAIFLLIPFSQAVAATMKFRTVMFHKNAQVIKVSDIEGHIMAVAELTGLASLDTGEMAVATVSAFADYIKGNGTAQGYIRLSFEDGSTIDYKYLHTTEALPDGKTSLFKSKSVEITQGTGKYAGIQGEGSFTGKRIAPFGTGAQLFLDTTLTYRLP